MPHAICTAFYRDARPCTARAQVEGRCYRHDTMARSPTFTQDQARLRTRWEAQIQVVAVPAALPQPPAAPAPRVCGHLKGNGQPCEAVATQPDGRCRTHHNVVVRRADNAVNRMVMTGIRTRYNRGETDQQIDDYVAAALPTISERYRPQIINYADTLIVRDFLLEAQELVAQGATAPVMTEIIQAWVATGRVALRRGELVVLNVERMIQAREWRAQIMQPRVDLRGREAQLAADSQNVHTAEISKQMKDSIDLLLAVEVPVTQNNTVNEISEGWVKFEPSPTIRSVVYRDLVTWWNRPTIYQPNDKLYRKCLRGLWCTIKSYKGEVRAELEKRLWDECKDGAIPYSVCTQGHMARLSNVMVGFDDAFAPPIPVGEILQQKMAAIAAMDIESEKQIELAKALLAELKVPEEKHSDWLAAF